MLRVECVGCANVPKACQLLEITCETAEGTLLFRTAESEISRGGEVLIDT